MSAVNKLTLLLVSLLIGIVLITTVSLKIWKGIGADPNQPTKATGLNQTVQNQMNGVVP